jgi:hypothetical protein
MAPLKKRVYSKANNAKHAASAVVSAAAGLAMATIATAAEEATKTLSAAAGIALKTLETAAAKAISEFPDMKTDIREIRAAQGAQTATILDAVTCLIQEHTHAEELRLKAIDESTARIDTHAEARNLRLTDVEKSMTRLNLAIFGAGGPLAAITAGYFLHSLYVKLFG